MNTIRNITLIACYLGIAISILDIMSPSEKLKKQLRFIFALVFIIAIATPILNGRINLEIPAFEPIEESDEYLAVQKTFSENVTEKFRSNIEQVIRQKLEAAEIIPKEISVNVNIDENNCISISEVKIVLAVQDNIISTKAGKIVKNEIGNVPVNIKAAEEKFEG